MLLQIVNVLYVLVAVAIIAFVLLQQGSGASAGSGFGGGASATVFGARGASNFLSKSTKWLAIAFFTISMGMAMYASKRATGNTLAQTDLGVMGQPAPAAPAAQIPTATVPEAAVPSAPAQTATPATTPKAVTIETTQQPAPQGK